MDHRYLTLPTASTNVAFADRLRTPWVEEQGVMEGLTVPTAEKR